jgi:hypothetical protein
MAVAGAAIAVAIDEIVKSCRAPEQHNDTEKK